MHGSQLRYRWFKRKWELTSHVRTHDDDSLKCDEFDLTMKLEKHLKEHKFLHSHDLPYVCKLFEKRFKYRSGLKRQLRQTSQVKRYSHLINMILWNTPLCYLLLVV